MQSDKMLCIDKSKLSKYLKTYGFSDLDKIVSALYNNNKYTNTIKRTMWKEQCCINFPLLYICSIYLYIYAKEKKCKKILFVTRDCCHWYKIFRMIFPDRECYYFDASRNMLEKATYNKHNEYNIYVKSIIDKPEECIFVDIHGTGKRIFNYFFERYNKVPYYFLLSSTYLNMSDFPSISYRYKNKCVVLTFDIRGSPVEMLNYDLIGTLQDYKKGKPIRDNLEYDYDLIEIYHNTIDEVLKYIKPLNIDTKRHKYSYKNLRSLIKKLISPIANNKPIISKYINHIGKHLKNK